MQCKHTLYTTIAHLISVIIVVLLSWNSYGASVTTPAERVTRLARFDGVEQCGQLFASALSPVLLNNLSYYGVFIPRTLTFGAALLYLAFFVKEPTEKSGVALEGKLVPGPDIVI